MQNKVENFLPNPFLKKNWAGSIVWNFIQFVLIAFQVEGYRSIFKVSCRPIAFPSVKAFLKNKKRSGTTLPASFSAWLLRENISFVRYLTS